MDTTLNSHIPNVVGPLIYNSPCVASVAGNSPSGGPGLSRLVHEEAHPSISYHT